MQSLAELQARIATALVDGDAAALAGELVGGAESRQRLAIHQRHYDASLTTALSDKFPACLWLVGAPLVRAAARAYAHAHPPLQPCIAEYGGAFPSFLASFDRARELSYLAAFATLEWEIGRSSIAVDAPPLSWPQLARVGSERLLAGRVTLQPGVRYLRFAWAVDELMELYLRGAEPDRFVLSQLDVRVEVRGARGALGLTRLDAGTFAFRAALAAGRTIGDAAGEALELDGAFDAGRALRELVDARLTIAISIADSGATA